MKPFLAKSFLIHSNYLKTMKKFIFGLAFIGAIFLFNEGAVAQESLEPGDGGGSTICCQKTGAFCQDRFGNAYSDSIESPGPTCTRP
jgi:hypothetical protein